MRTVSPAPASGPAETVNIGILAHVDAGKTSLTERLLYDTGVIDRLGSVDSGTTQTDTGDIERSRGITIRSAVAAFTVPGSPVSGSGVSRSRVSGSPVSGSPVSGSGVSGSPGFTGVIAPRRVNLIDTPGHSDFVAEVERALGVLDGAVLVISAVEGVQPHTRVLARILRALRLPTLIFVNKIDRMGARGTGLVADIARLLTPGAVPLGAVHDAGTATAGFRAYRPADPRTRTAWATVLADHDDALLADLVADVVPGQGRVHSALREQTAAGTVQPLIFGSALTGAGIPALLDAIGQLLPAAPTAEPRLRGRVFAVERDAAGRKIAYLRSYGGELADRQRVTGYRRESDGRLGSYRAQVTGVHVVGSPVAGGMVAGSPVAGGPTAGRPAAGGPVAGSLDRPRGLTAGRIGKVQGLGGVRIGDQIGSPDGLDEAAHFPRPSLETVVRPADPARVGALHAALVQLADEDPLIRTRVAPDGATSVLLYGEVQKEVIAATLAQRYGIVARFAPSQVVHLERPTGVGSAVEYITAEFVATIGLRVEPGEGVQYRLEVELGSLPLAFHRAIEETVRSSLEQGRYGWPVTDVTVTLTHSGFVCRPGSAAGDFRGLAPLVLMKALRQAGTRVFEPCHQFELEVPAERFGTVTAHLAHLGARIDATAERAGGWSITGELPARLVREVQQQLPRLTNGEGLWSSVPHGDRLVLGAPPRRPRTDGNPFDRVEYTRFLAQRALATGTPAASSAGSAPGPSSSAGSAAGSAGGAAAGGDGAPEPRGRSRSRSRSRGSRATPAGRGAGRGS